MERKIDVARMVGDPYFRQKLDPRSPFPIGERVRRSMGELAPVALAAGADYLLGAMEQENNPDPQVAAEIRTAAVALLEPMVSWGKTKGVNPVVYKEKLLPVLARQRRMVTAIHRDSVIFSTHEEQKQGTEQGVYENIRALLQASDIITNYLPKRHHEDIHTELENLAEVIQDVALQQDIPDRVRKPSPQTQERQPSQEVTRQETQRPKATTRESRTAFREEVLTLYQEGKSASEIAGITHRQRKDVYTAIDWHKKQGNIQKTNLGKQLQEAKEVRELAHAGFAAGKTNAEIAKALPDHLSRTEHAIAHYRTEWNKKQKDSSEGTAGNAPINS
jgi:hypothetical protein